MGNAQTHSNASQERQSVHQHHPCAGSVSYLWNRPVPMEHSVAAGLPAGSQAPGEGLCLFPCTQDSQSISMTQHQSAISPCPGLQRAQQPSRATWRFPSVHPHVLISRVRYKTKGKKGTEMSKELPPGSCRSPQQWGLKQWKPPTVRIVDVTSLEVLLWWGLFASFLNKQNNA